MEKKSVTFKGDLDATSVVKYLENLVKSLKGGTVCFQQKNDFVTLKTSSRIEVELSANQKKGKEKLSIELSWKREEEIVPKDVDFKISAKEPEMKKIEVTLGQSAQKTEGKPVSKPAATNNPPSAKVNKSK